VVWDKTYLPNTENFSKYAVIKEQWQEVYANQLTLVDRGLTASMWKAPGV
jgi:autoinducer 2 (AI-2) kinase